MQPAEVVSIVVDEDAHSMDVAVAEEKLSQAIGRGGQNIRLASELTGWNLNIMTTDAAEKKSESESRKLVEMFMKQLDVDEEVAAILVQEGFSTIEEVAYVPASELSSIEEFDEDIIKELRNRARDVLLTQAIATEENTKEVNEDIFDVEGMTEELATQLAQRGICSRDDLAEQAIDDLLVIDGMDKQRAGDLIMAARKHWFEETDKA
jgi:N utilization substance protein A